MHQTKLFIIEDLTITEKVTDVLHQNETLGIQVTETALTEEEALHKIDEIDHLDVLLTRPIDFTVMTAFQRKFPQLKIIEVLSKGQTKSIKSDAFIQKPFKLHYLITTIETLCEKEKLNHLDIDQQFKALSDATRRKILDLLQETTLTAGEIAEFCETTKPNISQHLKVLKNSGLVQEEKKGLYVYYSLSKFDFREAKKEVGTVLNIKEKILYDIQQLAYKKNCEPVVGATDSQDDGTFYMMKDTETLISFHYSFRLSSFFVNFEIPVYLQQGGSFHIRYDDTKAIEDLYEKITEELNQHLVQEEEQKELVEKIRYELKKYISEKTRNLNLFLNHDEKQLKQIDDWLNLFLEKNYEGKVPLHQLAKIKEEFKLDMFMLGKLHSVMEDSLVSEIMVNAPDDVWIEKCGKLIKTQIQFADHDEVLQLARKIAGHVGRRIDNSNPNLSARLPDGSKIHIILPPVSRRGINITIRKFFQEKLNVNDLIKFGTIDEEAAELLQKAVQSRANILVSGGVGAGKTTSLNILSNFIAEDERIITIEDSNELQINHPHVVSLETRPANAEGAGEVTLNNCLRMMQQLRPDRFILGEIRMGAAFQFLQACSTGHDGALSSIHARMPSEALERLQTFITYEGYDYPEKFIQQLIADNLDLVVQITRLKDGSRKITEITQIVGYDKERQAIILEPLYKWQVEDKVDGNFKGKFVYTGYSLCDKLQDKFEQWNISNPFEEATREGTEKELDVIEDKLPNFVSQLSEALRSGFTLNEALRYTHDLQQNELTDIFYNVAKETEKGVARTKALETIKDKYNSPLLHFLIHAMMIQENMGGPIALLLHQIIPMFEERNEFIKGKTRNEKEDLFVTDNWQFMEFLDLLACTAPSGGSLSHTIELIHPYVDNRFSQEFQTAIKEYEAGKPRRNALADASTRLNDEKVHYFVQRINQSEELGQSIVDTLKEEAKKWRKTMKNK